MKESHQIALAALIPIKPPYCDLIYTYRSKTNSQKNTNPHPALPNIPETEVHLFYCDGGIKFGMKDDEG